MAIKIQTSLQGPVQALLTTEESGLTIKDQSGVVIKDIESWIIQRLHRQTTKEYLMQKNNWTDEVTESINWLGIKDYLTPFSLQKRLKTLQLIHNWQTHRQTKTAV